MRSKSQKEVIADVVAVAIGCLFGVKLESARKVHDHLLQHAKAPAIEVVKLLSTIERVLKAIIGKAKTLGEAA